MSDTWTTGMLAGMGSGLLAPAGTPSSYSAREMRQKIALAMLMRQKKYPKTFGEGLAAIGEAWGENSMAKSLEQQAAAEAKAIETGAAAMPGLPTPSAATPAPPVAPGPQAALTVPPAEVADTSAAAPAPVPPGGVHPNVASWHNFATRPYDQGGLGVAPHQAAGIVGNLQAESGPTIKPVGVVGDAGTAFGAAQWRNDRYANLQNFAKANGMDPMTTEAQQAFMRHELRGSGAYGGGSEAKAFAALSGAQDPRSAAAAFDQSYERSSGAARGKRMAAAENLARVLSDPNSTPRDRIAAQEAVRTADTPLTPADTAQEARVSDVLGMTRAPPSFGATASNRTGNVQSDMPPVTGALQGALGASVGDTVQQRQDAIQPPQQAAPPPPGAQLAQAGAFPPPPGPDAGGRIPAIIPGGGLPPAPPTAAPIPAAPPDPRTAIRSAPVPEPYEMKEPVAPKPPTKPTMGPIEQQLTRDYLNKDISPQLKAIAQQRIDYERGQLNAVYENQKLQHEMDKAIHVKKMETYDNWRINQRKDEADTQGKLATTRSTTLDADKKALELGGYPAQLVQERLKREAEVGKAQSEAELKQEEARITKRTGMDPVKLYERLDKEKAGVEQTLKAQGAQQLARKAIKDGVITGYGANGVVAGAKFADWAFKNGMSGNLAANTEIMSSALKAGLSEAVKTVNGEGGTGVSNTDVRIAEGISGSDPQLQMKTIKSIMDRAAEINHRKIDGYETKVDRYLSGEKAEDFYKIGGSTVPQEKLQILLTEPTDQRKAQFNDVYGPGAAELELARFKRAQDRKGL